SALADESVYRWHRHLFASKREISQRIAAAVLFVRGSAQAHRNFILLTSKSRAGVLKCTVICVAKTCLNIARSWRYLCIHGDLTGDSIDSKTTTGELYPGNMM